MKVLSYDSLLPSCLEEPHPWETPPTAFIVIPPNIIPTPFTSHRLLSKNGNCLKLKLQCVSVGFGGREKKMEEVGVKGVDENNLSHHFLEDTAVHQEPAEKSGGTGRAVCSD